MIFYLTEVQQKIGYEFKNPDLLRACFTHGSYTSEFKNSIDNERLEFLGDSVLGFVVADYLYRYKRQDEGGMTEDKQGIVSTKPLAQAIDKLGLHKYLLKSPTLKITDKLKENLFEAVVAGIYLDGGLEEARSFIMKNLVKSIKNIGSFTASDFKSQINEYSAKHKFGTIKYKLKSKKGSDHEPTFEVEAMLNGNVLSVGVGKSKKQAEQKSAELALKKLKKMVKNNA